MQKGARVVGVDPGFTDIVTVSEKGMQSKSFSSAQYYEQAKFFRSARKTMRWNKDTLDDVTNLPTSQTSDLEKFENHCRRYIEVLPRITKHRAIKGYRAMRFTRYVYRAKAINAICDLIAPRDGRFSVVMFGDWNGVRYQGKRAARYRRSSSGFDRPPMWTFGRSMSFGHR